MSFMTISFKKATNKTSIKHNNRKFDEKDWGSDYHKHIDRFRSENNRYLVQRDIHEMYDEIFGRALEVYNAKQKRKDRRISDYYQHVKKSKTLELQREFIIQVGNVEDFQIEENWQKANYILEKYVETFEARNPQFRVYNAVIHNDEASPHLHINVIPVAHGYKRGLTLQPSFDKAIRQQGIETNAKDSREVFRAFRDGEIQAVAEIAREMNIERKLGETNKFKDTREYKKYQQGLNELKNDIADKKTEFREINLQTTRLESVKTNLESRTDVLKEKVDKYTEDIKKLHTEQNKAEKRLEEQKQENIDLNVAISDLKLDLMLVSEKVEDINQRVAVAWHDDWLATKSQFPDFNMKTTITEQYEDSYGENSETFIQEVEVEVSVDENTPKTYNFDFRRTLELFNEKVEGFVSYLKEKALEFKNKALELLDKEGQLEDREKALNMRELDIDENLAKREREVDEKLVKLDNQSVLLTEKEVELERIDKMIESRNEVLININESWSINQTNLINKLQGVVENTKKTRFGSGWIIDKQELGVIKQAKTHLEENNPGNLIKANQDLNQSYLALKQEFKSGTLQDIRIEVAKKTKNLEDEIRDLKKKNANDNKDNQALINIIIDLAQKADKKENAYELHYDLGKTLFEQGGPLTKESKQLIDDRLINKLSTRGFTDGYNAAKQQFEQERIERIQRLNGLNHDRGGLSL
ncbi:plasmid recombination protein [Enterococcus cecorum]|uniref:plasmid recombination protein n=1 Tax=Enterococcus cecorum TaxID=44008 RepID=UPI003F20436C